MKYTIDNGKIAVTVSSDGAELISVIKDGKEWIWQNPTGEWAGHAPILFPVCGHFGLKHEGVEYPLPSHGFAKRKPFTLVSKSDERIELVLCADESTKEVYPFDFCLHVVYAICGSKLTVEYIVENVGETPLYFACGSHESYNLDANVDNYALVFEKEESFVNYHHNDQGYLTGETSDYGTGKTFALPYDYLQKSRTVIFKDLNSRKVTLCEKSGRQVAKITFDGFANLLLWRAANTPYICIEPWTNLPDPDGVPDVEFSTKAGVIKVEAGQVKKMVRTIEYL